MKTPHRWWIAMLVFNGCYCVGGGGGAGGCAGFGSGGAGGCLSNVRVASLPDAGLDAGLDAGEPDAGGGDAGEPDDAGSPDAGDPNPKDAGATGCDAGFALCGNRCLPGSWLPLRHHSSNPLSFAPYSLAIGRLNADSLGDLAAVGPAGAQVLLGNPDGGRFILGQALTGPNGNPLDVRVGDLNGGGQVDIAVSHAANARATLYYGRGDGTFDAAVTVAMGQMSSTSRAFALGDFNGDGRFDLLGANYPWDLGIAASAAGGGFVPPSSYTGLYVPRGVATGDLDRDGRLDAVVSTMGFGAASVVWGDGDGGFSGHRELGLSGDGRGVVTADFDRDGRLDIALLDSNFQVQVVSGTADGGFTAGSPVAGAMGDHLVTGDFDGDGRPDLATARGYEVMLVLNPSGFSAPKRLSIRPNSLEAAAVSLSAGDLNRDGISDLAIGNAYHVAVEALVSTCPGAQVQCGDGLSCGLGQVCCFNVADAGLSCETPNGSLTGPGQRCPMPSVQSSIECASQADCPGTWCCGSGAVSQCAGSCAATSRVCSSADECGGGENCCPQSTGPLKVCRSTSC